MKPKLTRQDLINRVQQQGLSNQNATAATKTILQTLGNALGEGRKVELRGFGSFEFQTRKARIGRNPKKPNVAIKIPPSCKVKFRAGNALKTQLKKLKPKSDG